MPNPISLIELSPFVVRLRLPTKSVSHQTQKLSEKHIFVNLSPTRLTSPLILPSNHDFFSKLPHTSPLYLPPMGQIVSVVRRSLKRKREPESDGLNQARKVLAVECPNKEGILFHLAHISNRNGLMYAFVFVC
jgi:hypothetical protein